MEKVKIFQFPVANAKGGITQYVLQNWKYIDRSRFQFDFGTCKPSLDFQEQIIEEGGRVRYIPCYAEDDEKTFIETFRRILSDGYDAIHLHTSWWKSFLVEELAKEYHVPKVIVHAHNTMIDVKDPLKRAVELHNHERVKSRLTKDLATDFCACSWAAADWIFGDQIPRSMIRRLNNAIDIRRFAYNERIRNEYRQLMGLEDCFVIGHIGRFTMQKNHSFLLNVFKLVLSQIPNSRLLLIGGGELEEPIKKELEQLGISNSVKLLGKRDDVNFLLQAMDIFLLPSLFEGLPIVLVEAQAAGLPCIASQEITRESAITGRITFLPLEADEWCRQIVDWKRGGVCFHSDTAMAVTQAGYCITEEIKKLEKLYSE